MRHCWCLFTPKLFHAQALGSGAVEPVAEPVSHALRAGLLKRLQIQPYNPAER